MPVGNVNSQERGAGARYNDGKVPLELIPAWILALFDYGTLDRVSARGLIEMLGRWQQGKLEARGIVMSLSLQDAHDAALVFGYGAQKYAAWNWIKGMPWSVPLGCALRHAFAILRGEQLDPESGLPHRGHLACNLVMLAQFERTYPEGDDRPIKWLSTDAHAALTGGPGSQEDSVSAPRKPTEIEQPQCYDPPGRGHELVPPEEWRPDGYRQRPDLELPSYVKPFDLTPRNQEDPWKRPAKEIPVSEGQRMYEEWVRAQSETRSTTTSDSPETSAASDGPSPSSGGFDPAD
jgi:hypothetical protein